MGYLFAPISDEELSAGFAIGGTLSSCLVQMRLLGPKSRKLTKRGRLVLYDCFAQYTEKGHP